MIQKFVDNFMKHKPQIEAALKEKHPDEYKDLVKLVVQHISDPDEYGDIDPERIHEINDGDYQGTLLYVIGQNSYQPSQYWYVKVDYGSCSGCDTLESIRSYDDSPPTQEQINDYMTLCLHIVQGLKLMEDSED